MKEEFIAELDVVNSMLERFLEMLEQQSDVDKRWAAIGKTDVQKGIMALRRAIYNTGKF